MLYPKYQITYLLNTPVVQEKFLIPHDEFLERYKPALTIIAKTKDLKRLPDNTIKKLPDGITQEDVDHSTIVLKDLPDLYFTTGSPLGMAWQTDCVLLTVIMNKEYRTKVQFKQIPL